MKLETLHDLFVDELKDLYNAEHQILKALPKMIKAATSPELSSAAFEEHNEVTEVQVRCRSAALTTVNLPLCLIRLLRT